jgi:hypothetical protein
VSVTTPSAADCEGLRKRLNRIEVAACPDNDIADRVGARLVFRNREEGRVGEGADTCVSEPCHHVVELDIPLRIREKILDSIGNQLGPSSSYGIRMPPEDSQDSRDEPRRAFAVAVAEQVSLLDGRERTTATNVDVGNVAVIEPDWNEPRVIWTALLQLPDGQYQFLVLIAPFASKALTGKACYESKSIVGNRAPNFRAPVLARPQVSCIPPHRDPGRFKRPL